MQLGDNLYNYEVDLSIFKDNVHVYDLSKNARVEVDGLVFKNIRLFTMQEIETPYNVIYSTSYSTSNPKDYTNTVSYGKYKRYEMVYLDEYDVARKITLDSRKHNVVILDN